jgi:membrane protein YdbS with pleckstrin-like domain
MTTNQPQVCPEIFRNEQVEVSHLPNADQVDWQPLHPRTRVVAMLTGLLPLVILVAAFGLLEYLAPTRLSAWLSHVGARSIVVTSAGLLLLNAVRQQLAISYRDYALREHDVQYRKGIFFRRRTVVPFNRIQHVEVLSGPLERHFSLARLKLFTAGTGFGDLTIRGLHRDTATRMRRYLLSHGPESQQDNPAAGSPDHHEW